MTRTMLTWEALHRIWQSSKKKILECNIVYRHDYKKTNFLNLKTTFLTRLLTKAMEKQHSGKQKRVQPIRKGAVGSEGAHKVLEQCVGQKVRVQAGGDLLLFFDL